MAQTSNVIGSKFVAPSLLNVIVNCNHNGDLVITDILEKIMFKTTTCGTFFHRQRLLQDEKGKPIAMLRAKNRTAHDRWNVFRGQSKSNSDMIFSAATKDIIQGGCTHVNVSLSGGNDCDFQIKGSWSKRNCTIYKGDSSSTTIIAQMRKLQSPEQFMVTIYPNVDHAFVVALIATVAVMHTPGRVKVGGHAASRVAAEIGADIAAEIAEIAAEIAIGTAEIAAEIAIGTAEIAVELL